eukprot:6666553-Pyramimonas_sp.AAC.1
MQHLLAKPCRGDDASRTRCGAAAARWPDSGYKGGWVKGVPEGCGGTGTPYCSLPSKEKHCAGKNHWTCP